MVNPLEEMNIESALNILRNAIEAINDASQKNASLSALETVQARLSIISSAPLYEADDGEINDEYRRAMMVFVERNYPIKGSLTLAGSLLHDL